MAITKVASADGALWTPGTPPAATRYQVVVDGPPDPGTGQRKQLRRRFKTSREARQWQAQAHTEVTKGTFVGRDRITVNAYLDGWLAGKHKVKPTTRQNYADALQVARRSFGQKALQDLTTTDVNRLVTGMLDGSLRRQGRGGVPLSPSAVRLTLTVLSMALAAAVKEGRLTRNVAALVEPPRQANTRRDVWDGDAITKFLAVADLDRLAGAWRLSMHALRRSEVLGLAWSDVDFEGGTIRVHRNRVQVGGQAILQDSTKSAAGERVLPITTGAVAGLKRTSAQQAQERLQAGSLYQETGLVAVDALGQPVTPRWYTDRFKALSKEAGAPVVRLHDTRHACGSHLLHKGVPLPIVSAFLGHASPAITAAIYSHEVKDDTNHDRIREALMAAGL